MADIHHTINNNIQATDEVLCFVFNKVNALPYEMNINLCSDLYILKYVNNKTKVLIYMLKENLGNILIS